MASGLPRQQLPFVLHFLLCFCAALLVYISLRTHDYLSVDGALRCLGVFHSGRPFLHGSNHLLYPVYVFGWTSLLRVLGMHADTPFAFISLVQAMNAIACAGCLAIFYGLIYKLTGSSAISSAVTVGYGVSHALLLHATSSAEPVMGLLWAFLAIAAASYGVSRRKNWGLFAAGLLLALAMASYQSMVLFGPVIAVSVLLCPDPQLLFRELRERTARTAGFVFGFLVGIPAIYGTAFFLAGTRTPHAMLSRFLQVDSTNVYGGFTVVKAGSILPGLAYALFPCLPRESGFRGLLTDEYRSWIPLTIFAIFVAALWLALLAFAAWKLWKVTTPYERVALSACATGLIVTVVPLMFWMPTYDKLWLQPLALLFAATAVQLSAGLRWFSRNGDKVQHLRVWGFILGAILIVWNSVPAVRSAVLPTPYLEAAQITANIVSPNDLLVGDWNEVFLLYQAIWAPRANSFNVPTQASASVENALTGLDDRVARTQASGNRVYFIGILDVSERDWNLILGRMIGLPYEAFAPYRLRSEKVGSFRYHRQYLTLRRIVAPSPNAPRRQGP